MSFWKVSAAALFISIQFTDLQRPVAEDLSEKTLASVSKSFEEFYNRNVQLDRELKKSPSFGPLVLKSGGPFYLSNDPYDPRIKRIHPDLQNLAANSDLVIEGIPEDVKATRCVRLSFVCSAYRVYVRRIFFNKGVSVLSGQSIVIARTGGTMDIDGRSVEAVDTHFAPLKLKDEYVFYLHFVQSSGIFKTLPDRTYAIGSNEVTDGFLKNGMPPVDRTTFMDEVEKTSKVTFQKEDGRQ